MKTRMYKTFEVLGSIVDSMPRFAVMGAVAAWRYIEPATTKDIDVLTDFPEEPIVTLGPIKEPLAAIGYTEFIDGGIVVEGWPVQPIPVSDTLDEEAIDNAEYDESIGGEKILFITGVYLCAFCVKAGRMKDKARLIQLLNANAATLDEVRRLCERHGLRSDFEKTIIDIRDELEIYEA